MERKESIRGGGLAILYKTRLRIQIVQGSIKETYNSFEYLCTRFYCKKKTFTILNLYRPPYSTKHPYTLKMFTQEFEEFLTELLELKGQTIIVGDFNINVNKQNDVDVENFARIINIHDMKQFVETKTHVKGGTIDLVITDGTFTEKSLTARVDQSFHTDHYPIKIQITGFKRANDNNTVIIKQVREWHKLDHAKFTQDLLNEPLLRPEVLTTLTAAETIDMYNSTIERLMNKHCPMTLKKYRKNRNGSGWYNATLQELKQKRRRIERKFLKARTSENKANLQIARNQYNSEVKRTRSKFYNKKIIDSTNDSKKMFKTLGKVLGNAKEKIIPTKDSEYVTAEKMAQFYTQKIDLIRREIHPQKVTYIQEKNIA